MKNLCGKTRPTDNPYQIWQAGDWEWRVLKKWQADDNKPFARWFCQVITPYAGSRGDLGDVYALEVMQNAICVYSEDVTQHPNYGG